MSTPVLNVMLVRVGPVHAGIGVLIHPFYRQVVICHTLSPHLLVDGNLSCFRFLAIVNKAVMNHILVPELLRMYIFPYLGYLPRAAAAES